MRLFQLLCAALILGVLPACTSAPQNAPQTTPKVALSISFPKDDLGRAVKLQAPAKRVVCIGPGATETIFAMGAENKLVGRDQISDYPKAVLTVPIVGDYTGPFVEKVIALRPDLVIVQGETYDKTRAENWQQKIGAPVAILVPTSLGKVGEGMEKIGAWLGRKKQAKKLAEIMYAGSPTVMSRSAFIEVERSPLWTAGKNTLVNSLLNKCSLHSVAEVEGYKQFNAESLLAKQPEFYIVPSAKPDLEKTLRELRAHPVLKQLRCVQKGFVIVVPADWALRPGPRLSDGQGMIYQSVKKLLDDEKQGNSQD